MNSNKQNRKDEFLNKINFLFKNIKEWCANKDLSVSSSEVKIDEEYLGSYSSQKLVIKNSVGKEIAQIVPIGASIIGAKGRIDIKGLHDDLIIVLLNKGGPKITTTITSGYGDSNITEGYFYRGIDEDGWYWIEDKRNKGHLFNSELFFELLAEISDYESK